MKVKSLTPWLVALVCFGPFLIAVAIYYGPWTLDWMPRLPGVRELVEPPVAAPAGWLEGGGGDGPGPYRWSLVYARMTPCEQQCVEDLERMSQVRSALGRDVDRTQRAFFHGGDPPADLNDGFLTRSLASPEGEVLVRALGAEPLERGRVFIADPRGYLIAGYPPDIGQRELLRDLKRLLGASRAE